MGKTQTQTMDVLDLRRRIAEELEARRCSIEPGHFSQWRSAEATIYGICGAVHVHAALGLPLGDMDDRRRWAKRVLAFRTEEDHFRGSDDSGPEHALCVAISSLQLLGQSIPEEVGPLAPLETYALPTWLDKLDWTTTHKPLWGSVTPVLASGLVGPEWGMTLADQLAERIDPAKPLATWCAEDDAPWRVISCIYHVTSTLDAGRLPYPHPELLLKRVLDLQWDQVDENETCTDCTDGDWAWLLLRLGEMCPGRDEQIIDAIRRVSARRVQQWNEHPESVLELGTFFIYCWLWCTAVFQQTCRDHYSGPAVRDTLNDPSLFRLV